MRKKQLFAMLLAGTLSIGMAPTSAFAAEEGTTVTIEERATDAPTEEAPEVPETPSEAPAEPTPEIPTETLTPEATVTPEMPTEAPETPAPEVSVTPEATVAPTEAPVTPTPEVDKEILVKTEAELNAAIAAAPESDASSEPFKIIVDENISLTASVSVPGNKNIVIVAAGKDIVISRAADMKGNMFQVEGTLTIQSAQAENGAAGTVTVSGYLDGNKAEGSIVNVAGGVFVMGDGVTLSDNTTTAKGGAIYNAGGRVVLTGGTIASNQAEAGGAVYSEGPVQIQGNLMISDNKKADGVTPDNIALKGEEAVLNVSNILSDGSKIGVNVIKGKAGQKVIQLTEGVEGLTMEAVLNAVTYEGTDFTLNEDGTLKAKEPEKPAVTPDVKLKTKPKWLSRSSVEFTCVANVAGWFYAGWGVTGEKAPSFDVNKDGTAIQANKEFKVTLKDFDEKNPITAYVLVKDKEGTLSKKRSLDLDEKTRPGNITATPTPEATVTPSPEVSLTATPTPGPTHTPVVPSVKESVVYGLEKPLEMAPNVFHPFEVIGAGRNNQNPGEGDAQWAFVGWAQKTKMPNYKGRENYPLSEIISKYYGNQSVYDEIGLETSPKIGSPKGIFDEKTIPIYIYLKKYVYNAEKKQWYGTDEVDYITCNLKTVKLDRSKYPGASGNGSGGPEGPGDSDALVTDPNSSDTGSSTASGAKTADESPVGNMLMLAFASVLAGGYVLVRRRKKETE